MLICCASPTRPACNRRRPRSDTSKVSLDQAVANHEAGTAPLLDVLRARVDYQTAAADLDHGAEPIRKDKIALARAIGLPLEQKYRLTDQAPFAALDNADPNVSVQQALDHRQDLKAFEQQVEAAKHKIRGSGGTLPYVAFSGRLWGYRTDPGPFPRDLRCGGQRPAFPSLKRPSCAAMRGERKRSSIKSRLN